MRWGMRPNGDGRPLFHDQNEDEMSAALEVIGEESNCLGTSNALVTT